MSAVNRKPAVPKPAEEVTSLKFSINPDSAKHCCGLQEVGGFYIGKARSLVDVKADLDEYLPALFATTIIEEATYEGQALANRDLPRLGFEKVKEFRGNSDDEDDDGNLLALWVRVRPDKAV